ncbi:MAG TPA: TVP38/TMEM64 family protein [Planctomycetota bacterium]|jgi:uncharacterized membrane protein YdjX (TVP38/TMEM64 family)|nr:TVP38/TMEM64 family protein [Planctomycetota bacterium]
MTRTSALRCITLLIVLVVCALCAAFVPLGPAFRDVLEWVRAQGTWGPILLAAVYVPASVLLVPGSLLTIGAGVLFGVLVGTVAVSVGSVAGAVAAFVLGRTLARDWIEQKVARSTKFRAIDRAVAQQGFRIVLLTRLSPVFPFTLLNYAFGLTKVSFRDYVVASWIGMLPGTVLFVYIGSALGSLSELFSPSERARTPAEWTFFIVGLVATGVTTVYVTRIAGHALRSAVDEPVQNPSPLDPSAEKRS